MGSDSQPGQGAGATRRYLVVCQNPHGDHLHTDWDRLTDAQNEAKSCFMECDCKPAIYKVLDDD